MMDTSNIHNTLTRRVANQNEIEGTSAGRDEQGRAPPHRVSTGEAPLLHSPNVLSGYIQLFLNLCIVLSIFWAVIRFVLMLKNDVDSRIQRLISAEQMKSKKCERDYIQNNCDPGVRVPALEALCEQWSECMHNNELLDINNYTSMSAKLWAQTLAEVINAFSKEISIRSLAFLFICSCSIIVVTNVAFTFYR